MTVMRPGFPAWALPDDMMPVYQKQFTGNDVAAMTACYSAPPAQKLPHVMPEMTVVSIRAASRRIRAMLDKIIDRPEPLDEDEHDGKTKPRSGRGQKLDFFIADRVFSCIETFRADSGKLKASN
jgi:hypothetical protein